MFTAFSCYIVFYKWHHFHFLMHIVWESHLYVALESHLYFSRAVRRSLLEIQLACILLMIWCPLHWANFASLWYSPDSDLQNIAECCPSLRCVNLNACTSITDSGISILVLKCVELHSIFVCDTSFGQNCVQSLCRNISRFDAVAMKMADHTNSLAYKLQILHIGSCKGERWSSFCFLPCLLRANVC